MFEGWRLEVMRALGCVGGLSLRTLNEEGRILRNHAPTNEAERGHVSDLLKQQTDSLIYKVFHFESLSSIAYLRSVKASRHMKQASNTPRFSLYDK